MGGNSVKSKHSISMLLGAAFLMITSAIGPAFLTQTAAFTEQYGASFSFIILLTIIVDIFAQLNVWRIIVVTGKRGQDVANEVVSGLGYFISFLVFVGGLAFNIGNIAGTGMAFNVLFGVDVKVGAVISAAICIAIFLIKEFGNAMDKFAQILGVLMLVLTFCVMVAAHPPVGEAMIRTVMPKKFDFLPFTTIIGGTVGGYITFSGAHRLLDGGMSGVKDVSETSNTSVFGVVVTGIMRYMLFLAVLGVVSRGIKLDPANPAVTPFLAVAGKVGYKLFGLVLWSAALSSVVGCAFTSVSFIRTYFKPIDDHFPKVVIGFIVFCTLFFILLGRPVTLLILAGALNGLILPFTLGAILIASRNKKIVGEDYHHPTWLVVGGIIVVIITAYSGIKSLGGMAALWRG